MKVAVVGLGAMGSRIATRLLTAGHDLVVAVRPLLERLGTVHHVGKLASGAAAKLVANAALLGSVALVGETIALARRLGLSDEATYDVLATTPLAAQSERRRRSIAEGKYPRRFALSLARKDADLVAAAAQGGHELGLLAATRSWLLDAEAAGFGGCDYTAVLARIVGAEGLAPQPAVSVSDAAALDYDALIVDLDGVIWRGGVPIEGAPEAVAVLRARNKRLLF